jgi:hypothetical protein
MPGFLGGSTGGSTGTGGEISFPKEFVDPVTKLRVSQPENLIDTDFEYGLQPTKWETVELINNTPSFFSKSGDTTIPNILSITTNAGTREITVVTAAAHEVSSGIPIQVTGTKSVTADGSYIINSVPNPTTFTYLCRANQPNTSSIEDLYSSIITGEFFQGSQLRIADASGIVTNDESTSLLTVRTESAHGFRTGTPFYFLNLNSTISQEFQSNNNAAKSFDSTNSAIAQTFDGSNTLSSINIDWSNSATVGGVTSTVSAVNTTNNTITVAHGVENFANQPLGTPLYYAITGGAGYFVDNPRGVLFLNSIDALGTSSSTFQVSAVPDGDVIPITASISGTFQLANQARTFAGNNVDPETEIPLTVVVGEELEFDGGNQGYVGEAALETAPNGVCTVLGYTSDSILVSVTAGAGLDYYVGAMVRYTTTGSAASGLANNTTYFIAEFSASSGDLYNIRLKALPNDTAFLAPSGGSGTQRFTKIGVSVDKDIVHIKDSNFTRNEMLQYTSPVDGEFAANYEQKFYFVDVAYDTHNYRLTESTFIPITATGGTILPDSYADGRFFRVHSFTATGSSTFEVQSVGNETAVQYLVVGGGGGGGSDMGGGGGGGGVFSGTTNVTPGTYNITVGAGGAGAPGPQRARRGFEGGNSSFIGTGANIVAFGGGGGASNHDSGVNPAGGVNNGQTVASGGGSSGGGAGAQDNRNPDGAYGGGRRGTGTPGQGTDGGTGSGFWYPGSGGGAGGAGRSNPPTGGSGTANAILGVNYLWGAGGGGANYSAFQNNSGGLGGGGGGAHNNFSNGGTGGINPGTSGGFGSINNNQSIPGGNGGANTGSGGGGGSHYTGPGGSGGSGIVVIRYPITPPPSGDYPIATGGSISTLTVGNDIYAVHRFTSVGSQTFTVTTPGSEALGSNTLEYMVIGGGGSGGSDMGGGGGAGGYLAGTITAVAGTYTVVVGAGGSGNNSGIGNRRGFEGGSSSLVGGGTNLVAFGGGGGASNHDRGNNPAGGLNNGQTVGSGGGCSGGGGGAQDNRNPDGAYGGSRRGTGTPGQGFEGGTGSGTWYPGSGGGAGGPGRSNPPTGGPGVQNSILGPAYWWAGGGGGSNYSAFQDNRGGRGGGGGGSPNNFDNRGLDGLNTASPGNGGNINSQTNVPGGNAAPNTGSGGGGGSHYNSNNFGGAGGSGIVVIRYKIGTVS